MNITKLKSTSTQYSMLYDVVCRFTRMERVCQCDQYPAKQHLLQMLVIQNKRSSVRPGSPNWEKTVLARVGCLANWLYAQSLSGKGSTYSNREKNVTMTIYIHHSFQECTWIGLHANLAVFQWFWNQDEHSETKTDQHSKWIPPLPHLLASNPSSD